MPSSPQNPLTPAQPVSADVKTGREVLVAEIDKHPIAEEANKVAETVDERIERGLVAEAFVAEAFDAEVKHAIQERFTEWKLRAESTQLVSPNVPKRNFKVPRRREPGPAPFYLL